MSKQVKKRMLIEKKYKMQTNFFFHFDPLYVAFTYLFTSAYYNRKKQPKIKQSKTT